MTADAHATNERALARLSSWIRHHRRLAGRLTGAAVLVAGGLVAGQLMRSGEPARDPAIDPVEQLIALAGNGEPPMSRIPHSPIPASSAPAGLPSVDDMIVRLKARLAANPGNAEGWRMLGWSEMAMGRAGPAAEAYGRAVALEPTSGALQSSYAEALATAAGGTVTTPALEAVSAALKLDPADARARYHLGLAKAQAGDRDGALALWNQLRAETIADADLGARVSAAIDTATRDLGDQVDLAPALLREHQPQDLH